MKKLMIAVCAIALAGMTQAATVGWSCAGLNSYAGDAYLFFVIGQGSGSQTSKNVTSIAQITALVAEGKSVADYAFGSGSVANNGYANVTTSGSGKTLDAGNTYEGFYIIFNDDSIPDATKYLAITSTQSSKLIQSPSGTAGSFTFAAQNQSAWANNASNWQAINVPEPTSGLLLVLGFAGLALRRRRA